MTEPEEENPFKTDIEVFLEVRIRDTVYSNRGNANVQVTGILREANIADLVLLRVTDEIREAIRDDS